MGVLFLVCICMWSRLSGPLALQIVTRRAAIDARTLRVVSPPSIVQIVVILFRACAIALTTNLVAQKDVEPLLGAFGGFRRGLPASLRNQATGQAMRVTVVYVTTTMMEPDRRGRPDGTLRKVIANAAADHNVLQPKRIDPSERFIQHVRREVRAVAALLDRVFRNPSSQIRIVGAILREKQF
jgi:hypothetical protein